MKFVARVQPELEITSFHATYYALLDLFARGSIKRLMISVPPQHGKSLGASTLLPAYMLGRNPDLRICIGSYSFALARRFGLGVQRVIGSDDYRAVFPETFLKGMKSDERAEAAIRTADEFDIVARDGGLRLVGREGSLTGNRVDVMILDDLYKDAAEANSPIIREAAWDWYTAVVRTRLHNDSQEIIVFTRWHEDDLIGRLTKMEKVIDIVSLNDINGLSGNEWVRINFEAIKTTPPSQIDPREVGEPLWAQRHSLELLRERQKLDPIVFKALYQGCPTAREGLLYAGFKTYDAIPEDVIKIANYTDVADMGTDKLCSVTYAVDKLRNILVLDVVYTDAPMEVSERMVAQMLLRWQVRVALVESNNGGRGFARTVQNLAKGCTVRCFHQASNKESRILTNSTAVCASIVMPENWRQIWTEFADDILNFRRVFKANRHDDAADVLTGIIETEIYDNSKRIKKIFLNTI